MTNSKYIFIFSDSKINVVPGSGNVLKMMELYELTATMSLRYPPEKAKLVYLEQVFNEEQAQERLNYLTRLPTQGKIELIVSINPEFLDLSLDKNFNEFVH